MYLLSEKQIDYIINDIRARGVEMESLHNDLVDHVCCIVEQNLEASGDFENFYSSVIKTFYKKELKEIEEETISLLKNKNYYAMKKVMITGGIISAALMTMGIVLKYLHAPGASFGIVTGIVLFSFIFLPLMFILKIKEKNQSKDKVLLALGSVVAISISLAIMFKLMHWPYANMLGIISVGTLFLLYMPINLITGIRNPDTKVNTIITSILLVVVCGLFLSLARTPNSSKLQNIKETAFYVRNEQLFKSEELHINHEIQNKNLASKFEDSKKIIVLCGEIKSFIIEQETGLKMLDADFEEKESWLNETLVKEYFPEESPAYKKYWSLVSMVQNYSKSIDNKKEIEGAIAILSDNNQKVTGALNNLTQVQMFILLNERKTLDSYN